MPSPSTYRRRARAAQRILIGNRLTHPHAPHGTQTGYHDYTCRCPPCTHAHRTHTANYRHRTQDTQ